MTLLLSRAHIVAAAYLSLSCSFTLAQQVVPPQATGTYRFGSFEGGPESINLANLNIHLDVPVRHKAGRSLDFSYDLTFDSNVWNVAGFATNSWAFTPGSGWSTTSFYQKGLANMLGGAQADYGLLTECQDTNGKVWAGNSSNPFVGASYISYLYYTDMRGTVHPLAGLVDGSQCGTDLPQTFWGYSGLGAAPDGSGIVTSIDSAQYPIGGTVEPVVQYYLPGVGTLATATNYGAANIDRNGNTITYTASLGATNGLNATLLSGSVLPIINPPPLVVGLAQLGTFEDTLGTTALTVSEQNTLEPSGFLSSGSYVYSYLDGNGNTSSYSLHYSKYNVASNFGCPNILESSTISGYTEYMNLLVDRLSLPDGRSYQFTYEPTPEKQGFYTGRIASITFPGGGSVSYSYGPPDCQGSVLSLSRIVNDGNGNSATWSYARSYSNGLWTTKVTDPNLNERQLSFLQSTPVAPLAPTGRFFEVSRAEYQGSVASGRLLRATSTSYNGMPPPQQWVQPYLNLYEPITTRQTTTTLPGPSGDKQSQVVDTYDGLGSVTDHKVFDFGMPGAGVGALRFEEVTAYDPVDVVFDTVAAVVDIYDGGQYVVQTLNQFDEVPTVATGAPHHTTTLPNPHNIGNVTTVMKMGVGGGSGSPPPLITHYTYNDTGTVATRTDANGTDTVSYTYGACGGAYQTQSVRTVQPSGVPLSSQSTWNCDGGVQLSSTDANGNSGFVAYQDLAWRASSKTDVLRTTTSFGYPTAASNASSMTTNYIGGVPGSSAVTAYDGLGRTILTQVQQGQQTGYTSIATSYDRLGNLAFTSIPYVGNLGAYTTAQPGTQYSYDGANRVTSTVDAGGGSTTYAYSGNDVLITTGPAPTGDSLQARQLEYDGLGNLTSVCEIISDSYSGTCGQTTAATGYFTTYDYAGPLLLAVHQNVQSSSGLTQTRTFTYDTLTRLVGSSLPETGTTSYVYDSDSDGTCTGSSPGDLIRKTDTIGNNVCMAYDSLHRILRRSVTAGSPYAVSSPTEYFVYDSAALAGAAMRNAKGSLAEAYTCF